MSTRPEVLFPLFAAITTLDGVGPKTAQALEHMGITKPADALMTLPHAGIDRQHRASVLDVTAPAIVTVTVTVQDHMPPRTKGRPYRINVGSE